ncbi:hypothetical protein [Halolamina pelagica]|uniref:hypothetical protein n=1 Tax=Halolamina pelagica TaxID=699431 RepID=UPI001EFA4408|nr:hypothetical protein [Halolamina pelagica]
MAPWFRPVWLSSWEFAGVVGAVLLLSGWGLAEAIRERDRLADGFRSLRDRVR